MDLLCIVFRCLCQICKISSAKFYKLCNRRFNCFLRYINAKFLEILTSDVQEISAFLTKSQKIHFFCQMHKLDLHGREEKHEMRNLEIIK